MRTPMRHMEQQRPPPMLSVTLLGPSIRYLMMGAASSSLSMTMVAAFSGSTWST
jgi:hypothetical protein